MKKAILLIVKFMVAAGSFYFLTRIIRWSEFWASLKEVSPWAFAAAVLLNLISAVIMSYRWRLLIKAAGQNIGSGPVISCTMLGMFFNQILPGSVSGDAARVVCLSGKAANWKVSAGTVLWDRVLGLVALVLLLLVFHPFYAGLVFEATVAAVLWLCFLAAILVFAAGHHPRFLALGGRLAAAAGKLGGPAGEAAAGELASSAGKFLSRRAVMVQAVILSLMVRIVWLGAAWVLSLSMGLAVPLSYFFFFVSLVELVRMLPISIQGLGVRELAFVYFLKPLGIGGAQATLLSMLFFTALTVAGLIGGIIYLFMRGKGGRIET